MIKAIEIPLEGSEEYLSSLFSYSTKPKQSNVASLEDYIAHAVNQTLLRDRYYGGWAQVLNQKGKYVLKMYCPHHDLSPYQKLIPAFLEAGSLALDLFKQCESKIPVKDRNTMRFLLPFGLTMVRTKSVQLLHFPPLETFAFQDYLYSPTNRRWENLLGYNKVVSANFPELETIVDCVPIAAPGDDSKGIAPFNEAFVPYVRKMLWARLNPHGKTTLPVVAYGEPVRDFLEKAFADQIKGELDTLSVIELRLSDQKVKTPVLCANHPSKYLYYTDDTDPAHFEEKKEVMTQDLIAAGWQATMARYPDSSPKKVLSELKKKWQGNRRVLDIMKQEDNQYSYML